MESKIFHVQCPYCGHIGAFKQDNDSNTYFSKDGGKIRDDDENIVICENKNCNMEFPVYLIPSKNEIPFIESVIYRGVKEKLWVVDSFVMGGGLWNRTAYGADLLLYSIQQGRRGALWIEYKHHPKFTFTQAQLRRFKHSLDADYLATRFIGLKHSAKDKDQIQIIAVWTPKLFKTFLKIIDPPFEKVVRRNSNRSKSPLFDFKFLGMEECLKKNSFTKLLYEYKGDDLKAFIQNPNLTLFELSQGIFGFGGSEFNTIPIDLAYNLVFNKLKITIHNLGEDLHQKYTLYQKEIPQRQVLSEHIRWRIEELLNQCYRPLFVADLHSLLGTDTIISRFLSNDGQFLEGRKLGLIIEEKLLLGVKYGIYEQFSLDRGSFFSYGIRGVNYIPLSKAASLFLDNIGEASYKPEIDYTISEIAEKVQLPNGTIRSRWNRGRKELIKRALVTEIRKTRPIILELSQKGFNYVHRLKRWKR